MPYQNYLNLLEALRTNCHLPPFPDPLPSTQLELELEDKVTLTIDYQEESDQISFFAELGQYPQEEELTLLRRVAQANYLWQETAGGTLAVRPGIHQLYFCYQINILHLNEASFLTLLESIIMTVLPWQAFAQDPSTPLAKNELTDQENNIDPVPAENSSLNNILNFS